MKARVTFEYEADLEQELRATGWSASCSIWLRSHSLPTVSDREVAN